MSQIVSILICDDDSLLLDLVSYRLKMDGHRILTCLDGLDALSALSVERIDILILDLMMPGLGGLEVLSTIRNDPFLSSLAVIVLSARSGETDVVSALRCGADDYIVKPFIPDELAIRIERIIVQRKLGQLNPDRVAA